MQQTLEAQVRAYIHSLNATGIEQDREMVFAVAGQINGARFRGKLHTPTLRANLRRLASALGTSEYATTIMNLAK